MRDRYTPKASIRFQEISTKCILKVSKKGKPKKKDTRLAPWEVKVLTSMEGMDYC